MQTVNDSKNKISNQLNISDKEDLFSDVHIINTFDAIKSRKQSIPV